MSKLKDYIQLMRPQATFVTVFVALVGMLIGGGTWLSPLTPLFVIWSFLFHWTGFANNEIEDLEYDKEAGKFHKALVAGKIPFRNAMNLVIVGQTLTAAFGGYIAGTNIVAWFWMLFAIISGIMYNMWCKQTYLNPIFIANTWTGIALFGYFTQTLIVTPLIVLFALDIWLMFFYDVAYLGYYKDPQDEKNILKALGATHDGKWFLPTLKTYIWGWSFKFGNMALGLLMWSYLKSEMWSGIMLIITMIWLFIITDLVTKHQEFDRRRVLRNCALSEMATYSVAMTSLGVLIGGPIQTILIILIPIMWFVGINRWIWGPHYGVAPNV